MSSEDDKPKTQSEPHDSAAAASDAPAVPEAKTGDAPDERMDLPKWNRARVKRKAVKGSEQDTFQGAVRQAGKAALRSAPMVIGLAVLVAAIIAGVIWWRGQLREEKAASTRFLAEAAAYRARGQIGDVDAMANERGGRPFPRPMARDEEALAAKVQASLDALEEAAPKSAAARMAVLVRGAKKVEAGEFVAAQETYASFLEAHGPRHELAYLAHEGIVAAREGQGDLEGALAQVEVMVGEEGDFYRDQALWHKARLLEKLERHDEALEVYRQYAREYPLDQSSFAWQQVRRRLSELDPDQVPAQSPGGPGDFLLP